MLGANPYNSAARCGSRPPTAISRPFEEARIAGETIFTPIFAVLITPQRTISLRELWLFCIILSDLSEEITVYHTVAWPYLSRNRIPSSSMHQLSTHGSPISQAVR